MNIAFTGHRDFEVQRLARPIVEHLLEQCRAHPEGVTFWCGMAAGFDLAAGEAVLEARRRGAKVALKCVIPFLGHDNSLNAEVRTLYHRLLREGDGTITLCDRYHKMVFLRRNDFLLEQADMVIAYYDPAKKGGTAYTIRNATKLHIPVVNILPPLQLSFF